MKTNILFFFLLFVFISCDRVYFAHYTYERPFVSPGIEFSKIKQGKWLLNEIECSNEYIRDRLTYLVMKKVTPYLDTNLYYIKDVKDIYLSNKYVENRYGALVKDKIELMPTRERLKEIKTATGFDYFINVKAYVVRDESSDDVLYKEYRQTETLVVVEVYDLNHAAIMFSDRVTGTVSVLNDGKIFKWIPSKGKMIMGGFKKIMRKMKRYQIKEKKNT